MLEYDSRWRIKFSIMDFSLLSTCKNHIEEKVRKSYTSVYRE